MPKLLSTLRSLADAFLGRTGKPDRLDTATRMAMDADFSERGERVASECEPPPMVDPLEELTQIVREWELEPPPQRPKVLTFPRRRGSR